MAAGVTAAIVHDMGDFVLGGIDFIVGSRKTTRLQDDAAALLNSLDELLVPATKQTAHD